MAYIDRDKVLKAVEKMDRLDKETKTKFEYDKEGFLLLIKSAPTADVVEVKRSQWVTNHNELVFKGNECIRKITIVQYDKTLNLDLCEYSIPFCLNCGEEIIENGAGDFVITKYCPNCGAKMDFEEVD